MIYKNCNGAVPNRCQNYFDEDKRKRLISNDFLTENEFEKLQTDIPGSFAPYRRMREFLAGPDKEYPPEIQELINRRDVLQAKIEDCCLDEKLELKINNKSNSFKLETLIWKELALII